MPSADAIRRRGDNKNKGSLAIGTPCMKLHGLADNSAKRYAK